MLSDDEIVSLALAARERVTSGRQSIASSGEDLMRALLRSPAVASVGELRRAHMARQNAWMAGLVDRPPTLPGEIGN